MKNQSKFFLVLVCISFMLTNIQMMEQNQSNMDRNQNIQPKFSHDVNSSYFFSNNSESTEAYLHFNQTDTILNEVKSYKGLTYNSEIMNISFTNIDYSLIRNISIDYDFNTNVSELGYKSAVGIHNWGTNASPSIADWTLLNSGQLFGVWANSESMEHNDTLYLQDLGATDIAYYKTINLTSSANFSVWMYTSSTTQATAIGFRNSSTSKWVGMIQIVGGRFQYINSGGTGYLDVGLTASAYTWYHIHVEYNYGSTYKIWINGVLLKTATCPSILPNQLLVRTQTAYTHFDALGISWNGFIQNTNNKSKFNFAIKNYESNSFTTINSSFIGNNSNQYQILTGGFRYGQIGNDFNLTLRYNVFHIYDYNVTIENITVFTIYLNLTDILIYPLTTMYLYSFDIDLFIELMLFIVIVGLILWTVKQYPNSKILLGIWLILLLFYFGISLLVSELPLMIILPIFIFLVTYLLLHLFVIYERKKK